MAINSLLPNIPDKDETDDASPYLLQRSQQPSIQPTQPVGSADAANLIRDKVARIFAVEPDAAAESAEAEIAPKRSKHQQYMHTLSTSGKDLATIQTEWHNYYIGLPDDEKHQVWQEFYASNTVTAAPIQMPQVLASPQAAQVLAEHKHGPIADSPKLSSSLRKKDSRSPAAVQKAIRNTVTGGGKLTVRHHIQSLAFGLGIGALVIFIFLFGFFNEVIIAPFIQPSRVDAATPVIVSASSIAASGTPEVIIPKINVEIPVNYTETSTNESVIEGDLEDGIVHYPSTVMPGQDGNAAFFGHSSNNILNSGKYKFAFVLLHTIVPGDTFYLTYHNTVFIYKVITKTVVNPSDVSVLNAVPGQTATATLITCDPPGTSLNRLVVVGQQISPNPAGDTAGTPIAQNTVATTLPGNGPTLFDRVIDTTIGKIIFASVSLAIVGFGFRRVHRPKLPSSQ